MANKRINIQVDFQGVSPMITRANGTVDWRTSLINLKRLFAGIDRGTQFRNLNTARPTQVVVQQAIVQATGTVTPAAVAVADTVSINGQALTATQRRASGTLTVALGNAGDTFVLNGSTFTAVNGAAGAQQYDISSGVNATIAASIANAIQTSLDTRVKGLLQATAAAAVVTIVATVPGLYYNAVTLVSTGAGRLTASGATLTGGAANTNNTFDPLGTNVQTGVEIARASNQSTTAAVQIAVATVSLATGVVTWTAKPPGVSGNAIALASSNGGRLAVSGATLTGGSAGAPVLKQF